MSESDAHDAQSRLLLRQSDERLTGRPGVSLLRCGLGLHLTSFTEGSGPSLWAWALWPLCTSSMRARAFSIDLLSSPSLRARAFHLLHCGLGPHCQSEVRPPSLSGPLPSRLSWQVSRDRSLRVKGLQAHLAQVSRPRPTPSTPLPCRTPLFLPSEHPRRRAHACEDWKEGVESGLRHDCPRRGSHGVPAYVGLGPLTTLNLLTVDSGFPP